MARRGRKKTIATVNNTQTEINTTNTVFETNMNNVNEVHIETKNNNNVQDSLNTEIQHEEEAQKNIVSNDVKTELYITIDKDNTYANEIDGVNVKEVKVSNNNTTIDGEDLNALKEYQNADDEKEEIEQSENDKIQMPFEVAKKRQTTREVFGSDMMGIIYG